MGLRLFSSSSYDRPAPTRVHTREIIREVPVYIREDIRTTAKLQKKLQDVNPNPKNYKIKKFFKYGKHKSDGHYLVVKIRYHGCTNFEGDKILVYEDARLTDLIGQGSIDPHFSNNKKYFSPIARFVPTKEGWDMANTFCFAMALKT